MPAHSASATQDSASSMIRRRTDAPALVRSIPGSLLQPHERLPIVILGKRVPGKTPNNDANRAQFDAWVARRWRGAARNAPGSLR